MRPLSLVPGESLLVFQQIESVGLFQAHALLGDVARSDDDVTHSALVPLAAPDARYLAASQWRRTCETQATNYMEQKHGAKITWSKTRAKYVQKHVQ